MTLKWHQGCRGCPTYILSVFTSTSSQSCLGKHFQLSPKGSSGPWRMGGPVTGQIAVNIPRVNPQQTHEVLADIHLTSGPSVGIILRCVLHYLSVLSRSMESLLSTAIISLIRHTLLSFTSFLSHFPIPLPEFPGIVFQMFLHSNPHARVCFWGNQINTDTKEY